MIKNITCPNCNQQIAEYKNSKTKNFTCPKCAAVFEIERIKIDRKEYGIADNTLVYCDGAAGSIVLPEEGIKKIGAWVFSNRVKLTEITLPSTLQEIGEKAFWFCYRLTNVCFPDSLKIIESQAFHLCDLRKVVIPKGVERIAKDAFDSCPSIKEIVVSEENPYYYVKNESLIDKRTGEIIVTCCRQKVFFTVYMDFFEGSRKAKKFNLRAIDRYDENRLIGAIKELEQNPDMFIICDSDTPMHDITYLQACNEEEGVHIEYHIEKDGKSSNWGCLCSIENCLEHFLAFIHGNFIPNADEWEHVVDL